MSELLYQAVMKVPTLTGTWQQRNAQLYAKLGGSSKYGTYQGNLQQNSWLLNQIRATNYFADWATPKTTSPAPAPTTSPTAVPQKTPANSAELAEYLNKNQEELNALENFDPFDGEASAEKIEGFAQDTLGMEGEAPVAPKFEETFQKLRVDMGLDSVEAGINEYKNMIREQENLLMQQRNTERGKTQRLGVIEGRIDQATRDRQEQISWLSSNVQYLTDVANSAYTYINMTMQFKQMDYNTAKEAYDSEFNKRMTVYESLVEQARDERDFKMALRQEQQKTASAQLSMYADMITSGQMRWSDMSESEQLAIHKLEVQAGLPVGFTSRIQIPKGSTIQSVTNRDDGRGNLYADILYVDPVTGAIEVTHTLIGKVPVKSSGGSGGTASFDGNSGAVAEMEALLWKKTGTDKNVSPDTYNQYKTQWIRNGGTSYGFDANFGRFVNENYAFRNANVYNLDPLYLQKLGKTGSSSTSTDPFK